MEKNRKFLYVLFSPCPEHFCAKRYPLQGSSLHRVKSRELWTPASLITMDICSLCDQETQSSATLNPADRAAHIRSSQRRRNPHTALDCPLGRILLHRCSAGGQEKTQWGVGCKHTSELLMAESPVSLVFFLLALTPPLKKPFPPVDSETMLSWIPFYLPSCLFSDPSTTLFPQWIPQRLFIAHNSVHTSLSQWWSVFTHDFC